MKKFVFVFFCASIILSSCAREENAECCEEFDDNAEKSINYEIEIPTTAEDIEPIRILPQGFILDSIIKLETDDVLYTQTAYYPISSSNQEFNKAIKKFVTDQVLLERPDGKPKDEFASTLFDMWITKMEIKDGKISCEFRTQSYTHGAAHYNHSSIKFDFKL